MIAWTIQELPPCSRTSLMSEPKRHHYVPKMLLRRWEDNPGSEHVYVLDRHEEVAPRRAHINDVTVIRHFYTRNRDRR